MFVPLSSNFCQCVICDKISITTMHFVNTYFLYTYSIVKGMIYLNLIDHFRLFFFLHKILKNQEKQVLILYAHESDKISQSTSILIAYGFLQKGKICVMDGNNKFTKVKSNTGEVVSSH